MIKQLFSIAAMAVAIMSASTVGADSDSRKRSFDFVGLWQGIDPVEGDVGIDSILPNEDGTFTVIVKAKFRPCPVINEEAFSIGRFVLQDGLLVSTDRTIFCGDGDVIEEFTPVIYKPVKGRDLLQAFVADFPEPVIVLHRMSVPPRGRVGSKR